MEFGKIMCFIPSPKLMIKWLGKCEWPQNHAK